MATVSKNYLDYAGLSEYDKLIKNYIDTADALAIKFAKISSDGNNLLLYKSKTAGSQTPDADADLAIPMGSAALKSLIQSLGTAVGATYTASPEGYSISFSGAGITASADVVSALNTVANEIGTIGSLQTTDKTSIVAAINEVLGAINTAIEGLDVSEFALASQSGNAITIKGIKEVDGKIAIGDGAGITLADVASTGAAGDVSTAAIDDGAATPTTLYPAGTTQSTLQAIARDLNALESKSVVTVEQQETAETGYASTYVVKQNGTQVGVKINIPKDFLVKSASIEVVTTPDVPYEGAKVGDKYIDFVINAKDASETAEHIYLPVNELVDVYTGGTNTEATVSISNTNEITVSVNKIAASKIAYSNTTSGSAVEETVQAALARLDGDDTTAGSVSKKIKDAIGGLDTSSDVAIASYAAGASGTADVITLAGSISETDGIIGAGNADTITLSTITNTQINDLFHN